MNKENREQRQSSIVEIIRSAGGPVSASVLAARLQVSRQVIVGDVALLRAAGTQITATPNGYVLEEDSFGYTGLMACQHNDEARLLEELYAIVDFGGTVLDVSIEHSTYGQIFGLLDVRSRHDADEFLKKLQDKKSKPLSGLTGGIHLHRIGCRNQETFQLIQADLLRRGIALK